MKGKLVLVAVLAILASSSRPAPDPVRAETRPLAELVPADVDLYLSLKNPERFVALLRNGRLGESLRDLGLADLLPDLGSDASRSEVAVGFKLPQGKSPVPELYVLVSSDGFDFESRLRAWIDEFRETLEALGCTIDVEDGDDGLVAMLSFLDTEVFSVYARADTLVLALEDAARGVSSLEESFASTPAFEKLHRASGDEDAEAVLYVRTRPLLALIHAALGGDALEEDPGGVGDLLRGLMALPAVRRAEGVGVAVSLSSDDEIDFATTVQQRSRP